MALGWLTHFFSQNCTEGARAQYKTTVYVSCQWKYISYISKAMVTLGVPGFKCFLIHSGVDEFPAVTRDQVDFGQYELLFLVKDENISNAKQEEFLPRPGRHLFSYVEQGRPFSFTLSVNWRTRRTWYSPTYT